FETRWHADARGRFESMEALLIGEPAGEPDERFLGQRHQLHAHQDQRRVTAFLGVAAEVPDALLPPLPRMDPPAVEHERAVQTMTTAEDRPAMREVRPEAR